MEKPNDTGKRDFRPSLNRYATLPMYKICWLPPQARTAPLTYRRQALPSKDLDFKGYHGFKIRLSSLPTAEDDWHSSISVYIWALPDSLNPFHSDACGFWDTSEGHVGSVILHFSPRLSQLLSPPVSGRKEDISLWHTNGLKGLTKAFCSPMRVTRAILCPKSLTTFGATEDEKEDREEVCLKGLLKGLAIVALLITKRSMSRSQSLQIGLGYPFADRCKIMNGEYKAEDR
ncbi:uncharacterized protein L199_000849 [Kwoniella botswanensis]|uniref:uncharacterized protein n=1 Tax=Kwoniella botswanensis TaxID=1268659 RepID=UPI00315D3BDD